MRATLLLALLSSAALAAPAPEPVQLERRRLVPPECEERCIVVLDVFLRCSQYKNTSTPVALACIGPACTPQNYTEVVDCVGCLYQANHKNSTPERLWAPFKAACGDTPTEAITSAPENDPRRESGSTHLSISTGPLLLSATASLLGAAATPFLF